jgi:flagellar hook-associated protein 1
MNIRGLFHTIDTSSKNLQVMSQGMLAASNNIANANSPDYIKNTMTTEATVIEGGIFGSDILSMFPSIDQFNLSNLQSQLSTVSSAEEVDKYLSQLDIYLGNPNDSSNLSTMLSDFFSAISVFSSDTSQSALAQNAVLKAENLANSISDLASKIHQLRLDADAEIVSVVDKINNSLENLKYLNDQKLIINNDPTSIANIQSQIIKNQKNLNELINVDYHTDQNGVLNISTDNGIKLLGTEKYKLEYNQASSLKIFKNDEALNPLKSFIISNDGTKTYGTELISGGKNSEIKSHISAGKLHGLQQVRDVILPEFLEKLDNFANQVIFSFNQIQNSGAGSKLRQEYIGEKITSNNEARDWNGKVRISVVNQDGNPVLLDDTDILRPLELDFDKLNEGYGNGKKISTKTIINEINDHFISAVSQPKVKIGHDINKPGIDNIRIVSSQNIDNSNEFNFDFEVDNAAATDFAFEILALDIDNGASITQHNQNIFNVEPGKKQRTAEYHQALLNNTSSEFDITARVKAVNSKTGEVFISDVTYKIDKNLIEVNNRFPAISASGDNTILGTKGANFVNTNLPSDFLSAQIIPDNLVNTNNVNGYFQLKTNNEQYRIIIDDMPLENTDNAFIDKNIFEAQKSIKGFSHYFGLNNLFSERSIDKVKNSALAMKVNQDILTSQGELLSKSSAKLNTSDKIVTNTVGKVASKGSFQLNSMPSIGDTITFGSDTYIFSNGSSNSNEIDISSADLSIVTDNIINKLNQAKLNLANYSVDPTQNNKINIEYAFKGAIGNNFQISYNLNTATASINNASSNNIGVGNLKDGEDVQITESIPQWGYGIAESDKSVLEKFLDLRSKKVEFDNSNLTGKKTVSLTDYINNDIFGSSQNIITSIRNNLANDQFILEKFQSKFIAQTAVSIDEELSNMIKFQTTYNASAKLIAAANKLFDSLLSIL